MGLITAFNEVLSCILTGISTAIFLGVFARFGLLPLVYITTKKPEEKEKEE
ncbi:hypothetical protein D3C87_1339240 [compost metagenome]